MQNELQLSNAGLPGQIQNQGIAQGLQSNLMQGQALPGYLAGLPGGVSQGQSMNEAQMGLQGLSTQFQQMGGLDSGSYAQAGANSYANTLNSNAQFNVQNLAQLMNLASGNAYQNVGMQTANNQMLGQQSGALAGSSGSGTVFANPFQTAFQGIGALSGTASGAGNLFKGIENLP